MMIPAAPNQGIKSSVGILALPFRSLYNNTSLQSIRCFFMDSHFKCSRIASHAPGFIVIVFCYKPSRSTLNVFELILKAYNRGILNRTAIFQDWAYRSFICCLLWTSVNISSQEAKGPISFSANIADMCIPSQIICDSIPRYLIFSTFSRTIPSKVYETWIFLSVSLLFASYCI